MKYSKYSESKFESFLDNEFKIMVPLTIIDKSTILYKNFRITENTNSNWVLSRMNGDSIYTFKLKSSAIVAATYYSKFKYKQIEELKCLDSGYWKNVVDISFFKQRVAEAADIITKDIFLSKLGIAYDRTYSLKREIIKRLKVDF